MSVESKRISAVSTPYILRWLPLDSLIWAAAVLVAAWIRHDYSFPPRFRVGLLVLAGVVVLLSIVCNFAVGVYSRRFVPGTFEEIVGSGAAGLLITLISLIFVFVQDFVVIPRSIPALAGAIGMLGVFGARTIARFYNIRRSNKQGAPTIVFGAGAAGRQVIRQLSEPSSKAYKPVAIIDDDPMASRLRIEGLRVQGTREDIVDIAQRTHATTLIIAVPSADAEVVRDVTHRASFAGLKVLTLPPLEQLIQRNSNSWELREIDLNDLLGRRPVSLNESEISSRITGKRILVTGAGGSIGSELCRQISRFSPAELMMLDRDESALHTTQLSIHGRALLDGRDTILADLRDLEALKQIFNDRKPEVVFHAAALKHLPLLETYPNEAWKTNVVGTQHVLEAAREAGVEVFVNISTDKAANPHCVLGYSKRVAERLTSTMAKQVPDALYVSVRFGNVLGSRGSVLTIFEEQLRKGGPITVTHPDVTRFFMTIPEACQLVLQASVIGAPGEVMVLDMGDAISIAQVAKDLIARSDNPDIEIVYTGLRDGEKMHEELFGDDEPQDNRRAHPLVSHADVPPLEVSDFDLHRFKDGVAARAWMDANSVTQQPS
ncbi:polysaccharide biosynthesis protein [Micrococcales bacterium 31B]|nr:polysaccharide biosynthesis protein [Micrococcales bacterium 31B]